MLFSKKEGAVVVNNVRNFADKMNFKMSVVSWVDAAKGRHDMPTAPFHPHLEADGRRNEVEYHHRLL